MQSEIAEIPSVFEKMTQSQGQFLALSDLLETNQIQSVLVLARGTSDNAAHFLKYLIETQLGLPVGLTSPSSVTIYNTELKFKKTLVIAISQSGQSTDLVEYAKAAKTGGAVIISITNNAASPLAKLADHHLDLMAGKELAVAATKSYAAQLLVSLLLVNAWAKKFVDLDVLVAASKALKNIDADIASAVKNCDVSEEMLVLGRGFSYPNAREAALKIQETSKISVQGLSLADYMHGPISALTNNSQVFIMAPNNSPVASIQSDLEKIRSKKPKIFWIGTNEIALPAEIVINGSKCDNEIYSNIIDCIILQTFALEFARKNNLDPDKPEGLSKVTFTL